MGNSQNSTQKMWTLVYGLYDFEWDVYMPYLNEHMKLMPKLGNVGQKTIICGPESFTPDSQPIFGAESQVSNIVMGNEPGLNQTRLVSDG